MYSAISIADYMLARSDGDLTPLHIIKLVYISHGYTLALKNKPLIGDRIEAWPYGPVIPALYHTFKQYGDDPIPRLYYCRTELGSDQIINRMKSLIGILQTETDILNKVQERYGELTGSQLIDITHMEGTPWSKCYVKGQKSTPIPNRIIKKHYKDLVNGRTAGQH